MRTIIDNQIVSIKESNPCKRMVIACERWYLDFPYIQYAILASGKFYVSATKEPFDITKRNQLLCVPLNNITYDGYVCLSKALRGEKKEDNKAFPSCSLDDTISRFWQTKFNWEIICLPLSCFSYCSNTVDAAEKKYFKYWQKHGMPELPIGIQWFFNDPNFLTNPNPENYWAPGKYAYYSNNIAGGSIEYYKEKEKEIKIKNRESNVSIFSTKSCVDFELMNAEALYYKEYGNYVSEKNKLYSDFVKQNIEKD